MRRVGLAAVAVVAWVSVGGGGCSKPRGAPKLTAPTMEQAKAFTEKLEKSLDPCDDAALAEAYDLDLFVDRVLANMDVSDRDRRDVRREARDAISLCFNAGPSAGAGYQLVHINTVDGAPRPLFRLAHPGGGVSYIEFVLNVVPGGTVRIVDSYMYAVGGTLSGSLRAMLDRVKDPVTGQSLARLGGAMEQGDRETARSIIDGLPKALRESKEIRLMEVQISDDDDKIYAEKIEAYRTAFPGDPSLDMMLVDAEFLKHDMPAAIAAIDQIDHKIGGDPFLDVLRSGAYVLMGKLDDAAKSAQRAVDGDPRLLDGWRNLISIHASRDDLPAAMKALDQMRAKHPGFDEAQLADLDVWPKITQSKEYAAWKRAAPN